MSDLSFPVQPKTGWQESARFEPLQPQPPSSASPKEATVLLQEFAQWLQQWTNRVQAQIAQVEEQATPNHGEPIPPATIPIDAGAEQAGGINQVAALVPVAPPAPLAPESSIRPSGPPAHWLERMEHAKPPDHWQAYVQKKKAEDQDIRKQETALSRADFSAGSRNTDSQAAPGNRDLALRATEDAAHPNCITMPPVGSPVITRNAPEDHLLLSSVPAASAGEFDAQALATKLTPPTHEQSIAPTPPKTGLSTPQRETAAPVTLVTMRGWISELQAGVAAMLQTHGANPPPAPAPYIGQTPPTHRVEAAAPTGVVHAQPFAPPVVKLTLSSRDPSPPTATSAAANSSSPKTGLRFHPGQVQPPQQTPNATSLPDLSSFENLTASAKNQAPGAVLQLPPEKWPALPLMSPALTEQPVASPSAHLESPPAALWPALPPVPMADRSTSSFSHPATGSSRSATSPQAPPQALLADERWPTLPEETHPTPEASPAAWRQLAYQQARRQRLDREQQGTVWNA